MDDDFQKYKTSYISKPKKEIKMNKIWVQNHNTLPEGMASKIIIDKKIVKDSVDLLNGEYKKESNAKPNYIRREMNRSSSSKLMEEVSKKSKIILLKIGKHVKKIKQSMTDITKMNGLYLDEKAKKNYNNKKGIIPKLRKNKSTEDINKNKTFTDNLNKFKNNLNYSDNEDDDNKLNQNKKTKKENYVKNFVYVNDNYRKQLNFAFLKYNPQAHLDNLKILVQADPSIRKDITKIQEEIEEDIKWKCDKHHFRKKYLQFLAKNRRDGSVPARKSKKSNNNNLSLPNINKKKLKLEKSISKVFKQVNINDIINKKEEKKISQQKELTKEQIRHMLIASKEIDNLIQNDNINDKIDLFKTDYAKLMYYPRLNDNNSSKKENNLLEKDYFVDDKKKVVEKIGDVFAFRMNKNINEKERLYKGRINNENEKFKKRVIEGKQSALDEFNSYIMNYQVKLPQDSQIND